MATQTQIRAKVKECVSLAKQLYGFPLTYGQIDITFKSKGQAAASAWMKGFKWTAPEDKTYGLKFSTESASLDSDEMLNDTVPHEVAHLVCMYNESLGKNHDYGWVRVCKALGGSGSRTHNQTLTKGVYKSQYLYQTASGYQTKCGPAVHKRIQRGATYTTRKTHEKFGKTNFIRHITPDEHRAEHQVKVAEFRAAAGSPPASHKRQAPKKPTSHKRPTVPRDKFGLPTRASIPVAPGASKKVKAMAIYKAFSTNDRATIIGMFMRELDMTKAGASTYYANCKKG